MSGEPGRWTTNDVDAHTGLANSNRRKALWVRVANAVYGATEDAETAIRTANSALWNDFNRRLDRVQRWRSGDGNQPRLL